MVKYSIIIPTCDRPEELALCLDLLAPGKQSLAFDYYEVIVTDDGRKYSARQMIEEKFPWAQWVAGPHSGPAANRNNGASGATGNWIVFTDDDCLPASGWLAALEEAMDDSKYVLEGKTTCEGGLPGILYEAPINEHGGCWWSCNLAIHKEVFNKHAGFDDRFPFASSEDAEFRDRLVAYGVESKFVPTAVVNHPPRRRPFGRGWDKRWQSKVLYENITGRTVWNRSTMWLRVMLFRLRELKQIRSVKEARIAIVSLMIESMSVALKRRKWNRIARRQLVTSRTVEPYI